MLVLDGVSFNTVAGSYFPVLPSANCCKGVVIIHVFCYDFLCLISLCTASRFMSIGYNSPVVVGSRAFVLHLMNLCAGDPDVSYIGIF